MSHAARIHVTVDRLVLRGVDPADRPHLIAALQSELGRVLSNPETRAAWAHSRRTTALRLDSIPFTPGPSGSRNLGKKIAQAIGRRRGLKEGITP
jgi:hypothetical protein